VVKNSSVGESRMITFSCVRLDHRRGLNGVIVHATWRPFLANSTFRSGISPLPSGLPMVSRYTEPTRGSNFERVLYKTLN
jgi:hypothetical protein